MKQACNVRNQMPVGYLVRKSDMPQLLCSCCEIVDCCHNTQYQDTGQSVPRLSEQLYEIPFSCVIMSRGHDMTAEIVSFQSHSDSHTFYMEYNKQQSTITRFYVDNLF